MLSQTQWVGYCLSTWLASCFPLSKRKPQPEHPEHNWTGFRGLKCAQYSRITRENSLWMIFLVFGIDGVHGQHIPSGRRLHFIFVIWGRFKKISSKGWWNGSVVKACEVNHGNDPSSIPKTNAVGAASSDPHVNICVHMHITTKIKCNKWLFFPISSDRQVRLGRRGSSQRNWLDRATGLSHKPQSCPGIGRRLSCSSCALRLAA